MHFNAVNNNSKFNFLLGVTYLANVKNLFKRLVVFIEPENNNTFALEETKSEKSKLNNEKTDNSSHNASPRLTKDNNQQNNEIPKENFKVSETLSLNMKYVKRRFSVPLNSDIIIREFQIHINDSVINSFIVFVDGMVDRKVIDDNMLEPLMLLSNLNIKYKTEDIVPYIKNQLLPHNQLKITNEFNSVITDVNFGSCSLFIDGVDFAFVADVKGFEHRGVEKPNNELIIRGPQEGFNETLRTNTSLIRKRLKDEDLIVESIEIGARSNTPCSLLYIKDIANDSLVSEVRRRITSIKIDYLNDSGELEQFIEDHPFLAAPQVTATERPDRVASMLTEGRVAVIVNGSPYALVMPVTFYDLIHSVEDKYTRFPIGNLLRLIRLLGIFAALLLPGFYIAITNYHQEMIPTSLLLAIESSREKVPFPSIVEILLMEVSFELIREAGIRIPGPIGPTLGIIGALILGQAAVAANIVSPILIIIVSVTGIGSFSVPDFTLGYSFRLLRFFYIILAMSSGFLGITTGIYIYGLLLANAKSFGVPFLAPFSPRVHGGESSEIYRRPIWNEEKRPSYLNPKDETKEPNISRGWTEKKHSSKYKFRRHKNGK